MQAVVLLGLFLAFSQVPSAEVLRPIARQPHVAAIGGGGWVGSDPHGILQYNNQGSCFGVTAHWQVMMRSDFQTVPGYWMNEYIVGAGFFAYLDQGYFHAPIGGGWSEKTVEPGYVVPNSSC